MSHSRMNRPSLLCLAALVCLVPVVWGQQPAQAPPTPNPLPSGEIKRPDAPPPLRPATSTLHECPPCGCHSAKVCTCEVQEKTVPTVCYKVKCKTICTPTVCGGCHKCGCGDGCGKPCGRVREVRVLLKRTVPVKKCVNVCVPVDVPCCQAAPCTEAATSSPPTRLPIR